MAGPGFVHLHVHSSYSLLEGALPIARLAELAKADRQPALALTDTDNMFGVLEFSEKLAGYGIQPIIGCALAVDFPDHEPPPRASVHSALPRLDLIAGREGVLRNLMGRTSLAFLDVPLGSPPHLRIEALAQSADGLIALTGGPAGPLDAAVATGQGELAAARCARLLEMFGDR